LSGRFSVTPGLSSGEDPGISFEAFLNSEISRASDEKHRDDARMTRTRRKTNETRQRRKIPPVKIVIGIK
jgi:hypothetical protein